MDKLTHLSNKIACNTATDTEIQQHSKLLNDFYTARYYTPCPNSSDHIHKWAVTGRPLSGNTWYECKSCGIETFRG